MGVESTEGHKLGEIVVNKGAAVRTTTALRILGIPGTRRASFLREVNDLLAELELPSLGYGNARLTQDIVLATLIANNYVDGEVLEGEDRCMTFIAKTGFRTKFLLTLDEVYS